MGKPVAIELYCSLFKSGSRIWIRAIKVSNNLWKRYIGHWLASLSNADRIFQIANHTRGTRPTRRRQGLDKSVTRVRNLCGTKFPTRLLSCFPRLRFLQGIISRRRAAAGGLVAARRRGAAVSSFVRATADCLPSSLGRRIVWHERPGVAVGRIEQHHPTTERHDRKATDFAARGAGWTIACRHPNPGRQIATADHRPADRYAVQTRWQRRRPARPINQLVSPISCVSLFACRGSSRGNKKRCQERIV